ncbi:glycosyltransferase family 4 protein [Halobacillus trueperi]|uniref:glycosyltransferase family 4 protein n=1 Tax=Halobacillus trueperi TaxID=156205 RepID=UPI003734E7E0
MEEKKLLHVFPVFKRGGTERVIEDINNYMNKKGYEINIFTSNIIDEEKLLSSGMSSYLWPYFYQKKKLFKNIKEMRKHIKNFSPDIIHTHSIYSLIVTYAAKKTLNLKVPIVHTGHGGPQKNYDEKALKFLWMADKYIAISSESYNFFIDKGKSNVEIIQNGISEPNNNEIVNLKENTYSKLKIAFIGRLTIQKGLDVLIRAVKILSDEGINIEVLVIGEGDSKEDYECMVADLNLTNKIDFLGSLSNPWEKVRNIPVVVMPSLWEPGGLVAMEAIARNHTLIASRVNGLRDIINDGVNGFFVEPGNTMDLSSKLKHIYKQNSYLNLTNEQKKEWLFEENTGPALEEIYNSLQ